MKCGFHMRLFKKYKDGVYFLNKEGLIAREPLENKDYPVMWYDSITTLKHSYDVKALIVNCPWNENWITVVKGELAWISIR